MILPNDIIYIVEKYSTIFIHTDDDADDTLKFNYFSPVIEKAVVNNIELSSGDKKYKTRLLVSIEDNTKFVSLEDEDIYVFKSLSEAKKFITTENKKIRKKLKDKIDNLIPIE